MSRQESYFAYLFGVIEPGFYGAIVSSSLIGFTLWIMMLLEPLEVTVFFSSFTLVILHFFQGHCIWEICSICAQVTSWLRSLVGGDKDIKLLQGNWMVDCLIYRHCTPNHILFAYVYALHLQEKYMVSMACYADEIGGVLHDMYQGSGKPLLFLLHGKNTDSDKFSKPADFQVDLSLSKVSEISFFFFFLQNFTYFHTVLVVVKDGGRGRWC